MGPEPLPRRLRPDSLLLHLALLAGVLACAIVLRWAAQTNHPYWAYDDAYISYRYAQNLRDGHGMVYNRGEWVLGTTTPLYTAILALLGLAEVLWAWGRSAQARDHLIEALAPDGTGGGDHPSDGEPAPVSEGPDAALLHHQDAFDRATRSGDAIGRAGAAAELAHVHLACGRSGEAHRLWRSALDLATGSCPVPSPPARGGGMTRS